uniref:WH1 domain-containing protein n=1 Tax=Strigamia maritima TaxID=126957 RepID=T1IYT1_STRMM
MNNDKEELEKQQEPEPEPVYSETNKVVPAKIAMQQINDKYDRLRSQEPIVVPINDNDLMQIEMFFQSHKTNVHVCPSLVNVYVAGPLGVSETPVWELKYTGILVLLLDRGETKARSRRQIRLAVAERGTGFVLWQDVINNLSNYAVHDPTFHTMYLSTDHRCMVGFSFDEATAAKQLIEKIDRLTSDPANISLSGPPTTKKNKTKRCKREKIKLPKKTDISSPCCFQHVTRLDMADRPNLYSLSTMTSAKEISE